MKTNRRFSLKHTMTLVLALALLLSMTNALAVTNTTDLYSVVDFKFHHEAYGIGCGPCPVYTAPSLDAYRVGNATCATNSEMYQGGFDESGWLLVRYETNNGGVRVGYIPPSYVRSYTTWVRTDFSYIPCTAMADLAITDNPMSRYASFGTIQAGDPYWILGKYTYYGNWWYVECVIDGQYARGFINRDTTTVQLTNGTTYGSTEDRDNLSEAFGPTSRNTNGYPDVSPYGSACRGTITVTHDASMVRQDADPNSAMVARAAFNEVFPYYEVRTGTTAKPWYLIYVDGVWGWISSGLCRAN